MVTNLPYVNSIIFLANLIQKSSQIKVAHSNEELRKKNEACCKYKYDFEALLKHLEAF